MKVIKHKKVKFLTSMIGESTIVEGEGISFHYNEPDWLSQYVFIISKSLGEPRMWKVTEYSTGKLVERGTKTKKEAINESYTTLIRHGEDTVRKAICKNKLGTTYYKWKLEQEDKQHEAE